MAVFAALASELGIPIAKSLISKLGSLKGAEGRFDKVERLMTAGRSAVDACKEAFGDDFLSALNQSRPVRAVWTFEAGQKDYVAVRVRSTKRAAKVRVLRDEISLNLQRLAELPFRNDSQLHSYFLGVMRTWMRRYHDLLGQDVDAQSSFASIESLLDGRKKTFADALKAIQQAGLPTAAALMIIYAVMVATGTGVGVAATLGMFLFGVPVAQVATLVVGGALLAALSRVKFTQTNAMSACIAIAYRLLEQQEKVALKSNEASARKVA